MKPKTVLIHNKKIPMRRCVVTNTILPKRELVRIVLNKDGQVFVDHTGKANGKGVYITPKVDLVRQAKKTKVLEKALKTKINDEVYEDLINEIIKYWD